MTVGMMIYVVFFYDRIFRFFFCNLGGHFPLFIDVIKGNFSKVLGEANDVLC